MVHYFLKDWVTFIVVRPGMPKAIIFSIFVCATFLASAALHRWVELPCRRITKGLVGRPKYASVGVPSTADPTSSSLAIGDRNWSTILASSWVAWACSSWLFGRFLLTWNSPGFDRLDHQVPKVRVGMFTVQ